VPNIVQAQRLFGDPDYRLRVVTKDLLEVASFRDACEVARVEPPHNFPTDNTWKTPVLAQLAEKRAESLHFCCELSTVSGSDAPWCFASPSVTHPLARAEAGTPSSPGNASDLLGVVCGDPERHHLRLARIPANAQCRPTRRRRGPW
jgi:hypothetical protein